MPDDAFEKMFRMFVCLCFFIIFFPLYFLFTFLTFVALSLIFGTVCAYCDIALALALFAYAFFFIFLQDSLGVFTIFFQIPIDGLK